MDANDVRDLNLTKFTKKWWQDRRHNKAKGCGVGSALDDWQKHCNRTPDSMSVAQVEKAQAVIEDLRQSLTKAIGKTRDASDETQAACKKMLKLIEPYENEVAIWSKTLSNETAERVGRVEEFRTGILAQAIRDVQAAANQLPALEEPIQTFVDESLSQTWDGNAKEQRLAAIREMQGRVRQMDKASAEPAVTVKGALTDLSDLIKAARKDPRFRTVYAQLARDQKEFDDLQTATYDKVNDLQDLLNRALKQTTTAPTVNSTIEDINQGLELLTQNPAWDFQLKIDDLKALGKTVVGWLKHPDRLTDEEWTEVYRREEEAQAHLAELDGSMPTMLRILQKNQVLAKRHEDSREVKQAFKALASAMTAKRKQYDEAKKLGTLVASNIDKLQAARG